MGENEMSVEAAINELEWHAAKCSFDADEWAVIVRTYIDALNARIKELEKRAEWAEKLNIHFTTVLK
jgi:hypothetical protein